jgi:leader peptidase (prepilin peptidase) / N-methyltransferase
VSTAVGVAFGALMGAILGSFFNVVIWRLPRGESLSKPASRCPSCGTPIKPWDNVPIVSWLVLRGTCRSCGARISARYPAVEALTAVLFALVVAKYGPDRDVWLPLVFVALLVPIAFIDLDHQIIPNKLTLLGTILALVLLVALQRDDLVEHLIAGLAAGLFFFVAVLAYPRGMGMGDVKLAGVMGLFLGRAVAPALFIAMILGTLVGAAIIARKGAAEGRKTKVPFGPFLAIGGVAGVFVGDAIVDWYLDTFTS